MTALNDFARSNFARSNADQPVPIKTLTVDLLTVRVYESAADVAMAGSAIARQILAKAIEEKRQANAIFATGRSQVQLLNHLTDPNRQPPIDWSKVTGFHLDEYLGIAADHPASFRHYLKKHLTSKVPLGQWHDLEGNALLPLEVCQSYEKQLREHLADLCFLGVGNNGHLAFNDPSVADFRDPRWVKIVRLDERNRQQQAESSAFASIEAVPQYAFTLTLSAIRASRHSLCLAYGEGKADVIHKMLTGSINTDCPASMLRQTPQASLLIDRSAANLYQALLDKASCHVTISPR